jgi:hypothetical protein
VLLLDGREEAMATRIVTGLLALVLAFVPSVALAFDPLSIQSAAPSRSTQFETRWDGAGHVEISIEEIQHAASVEPEAPRAARLDAFDPVLNLGLARPFTLFLDAPPSLTGESDVPAGARVEPNRVDSYFLSDDVVSVGLHGSFGRVWVDAVVAVNVYTALGIPAEKFEIEKRVLARREPHRALIGTTVALTEDRSLELVGHLGIEKPLDKTAAHAGGSLALRWSF